MLLTKFELYCTCILFVYIVFEHLHQNKQALAGVTFYQLASSVVHRQDSSARSDSPRSGAGNILASRAQLRNSLSYCFIYKEVAYLEDAPEDLGLASNGHAKLTRVTK